MYYSISGHIHLIALQLLREQLLATHFHTRVVSHPIALTGCCRSVALYREPAAPTLQRRVAALGILKEKLYPEPEEWHRGQTTSSGAEFWSFTDGAGKAHVMFSPPPRPPRQWLLAQTQQ